MLMEEVVPTPEQVDIFGCVKTFIADLLRM